jgi:quercetin dioxygenase-like cupin family protein
MVSRIYTGDDGQTHVEEYEVPLSAQNDGSTTELGEILSVASVQFRRTSPDNFIDWHNAPRRQYVITLSGESEVEFGDGTKVRLYPGHILLAEDTTGQGHISRALGDEDRLSIFVPID